MRKCILLSVLLTLCGCGGSDQQTGFLSDYSRLRQLSSTSFRYAAAPEMLGEYSKFIIDPVQVRFYSGNGTENTNVSQQDLTKLQNYMRQAMVDAISQRYQIVYQSGYRVGRIRVALTDLKKTKAFLKTAPDTGTVEAGLGSVSMEAEIIDSQTGKQMRAFVETQAGNRFSFEGLSRWGDVKAVIDRWAKELRRRIDEAHGSY